MNIIAKWIPYENLGGGVLELYYSWNASMTLIAQFYLESPPKLGKSGIPAPYSISLEPEKIKSGRIWMHEYEEVNKAVV